MRRGIRTLSMAALMTTAALTIAAAPPVALKTTEFGSGPTIVLVHGLGFGRMSWMPTARRLLAGYRVVMVDLPGHGDSALPDPFSLQAAADAVDRVVARQPGDSTVLVGEGVGGLLALMSSSAHPAHQRGVMLIDVALKSPLPIDDQQKKRFIEFMDANYDQVLQMTFGRMGRDSAQSTQIHAMAAQVPANTMKAYFRALLDVDGARALKDLKTPMLPVFTERVLGPGKDWNEVGKEIGWENPAAYTPRRVSGAGVLVASEQPDSLSALISGFAAQVLGRKQSLATQ